MALDYFILVFISSVGVYQIAAIIAGLDGLCFFKNRMIQVIFGILAIFLAFGWFYVSKDRNVHSRVEGSQQLGLFLFSIIASYIFTAILASLIQAKVNSVGGSPREDKQYNLGIETLKKTTLLGAIVSGLRRERKDKV